MDLGETLVSGLSSLRAHRLRSFLAMLGIIFGVGAVIEKVFEGGRGALAPLEVPVEALATVVDMSGGKIVLR